MLALLKNWPRTQSLASMPPAPIKPPRRGLPVQGYFWLGLLLLLGVCVLHGVGWRWTWLAEWQADKLYKQATGFALLAFILYQWRFSVVRAQGDPHKAAKLIGRHKWLGALAPLWLLGHSQALGYGYLAFLSLTFLLVFFTGLCNVEILKVRKPWFRPLWLVTHVGLSMALLFLASYHVYIGYAFK